MVLPNPLPLSYYWPCEVRHRTSICRMESGRNSVSGFPRTCCPANLFSSTRFQSRPTARSTEPAWPSRCDSLRGLHVFCTASLRSGSDPDFRSARPRGLALGAPGDCGDASRAVSRRASCPSALSSARDMDPAWLRRMAVGDGACICRCWCARWLDVLRYTCNEPASAGSSEIGSARVAQKSVRFSGHFLRYVSGARRRVLPSRPGNRCPRHARSLDVPILLPHYFCRADRSLSAFSNRLEKETNAH